MASKDIINSVDINNPSTTRRSADLLPTYHRTDKNVKFLASTLDQFIQQPQIKRVDGFVGSKLSANYDPTTDVYIDGTSTLRNAYQLEPSLVLSDVNKNIRMALGFDDLVNELSFNGADVKNLDKLFRPKSYSYNPMIDWDKFVNFNQYYWMPMGPDTIEVFGSRRDTISTFTVRDADDKYSLIFTPDGATTNPLITLYRGMTYIFNVDSEFPFYVKTAYVPGKQDLYSGASNNGTKKGQVVVTIDETSPKVLFYFAEGNPSAVGQFAIKSLTEDTALDVETEVLGKQTYKSSSGVVFSNGMKVKFVGSVTPEYYRNKEFIVEGVGTKITLIDFSTLQVVGDETTDLNVNFDAQPFDQYPFDDFRYVPLTPEYITINRAALDKNPWSKYNRWIHQDVITATAAANGVAANYPIEKRAQRPIIEFIAGLQLYNYGSVGKENVTLIDNEITDAFKRVEKSSGLYIDGVLVEPGDRVIFNADTDSLVRGKIYEVKFSVINGSQKIDLEEVLDSEPLVGEALIVTKGDQYRGSSWWFNGSEWVYGQQKNSLNQSPLWELFDESGNRYSDQDVYKSSFLGTKVFGYKIGTIHDSVLGFDLAYRNVVNVGEYLFENFFMTDSFTNFVNGNAELLYVSNGFLKLNSSIGPTFKTVWTKTDDRSIPIIQHQVFTEQAQFIEINSIDQPAYASDLKVEVFVNNTKLINGFDFIISSNESRLFVVPTTSFNEADRVLVKLYTSRSPNNNGYYEPPINLTNNPLNGSVGEFSYSELSDHVKTMVDANPSFVGLFPGSSNLRDLEEFSKYGTRIVSHSNPLSFSHLFHGTVENNLIVAIRKVADDYNQFKSNLLRHITELKGTYSPSQSLDLALISMNETKAGNAGYNYSDMLAYGKNNKTRIFTVTDSRNVRYSLASIFDTTVLSERSLLVYLNGDLLVKDYDYTINQYDPSITILRALSKNDNITVIDYPSTVGSFIPPTPTKLGLYPKFKPEIFVDNTFATGPRTVIQGHDGSILVAFGDYRDAVILEFEKRVYNNLKTNYNSGLVNIDSVIPGAFRTTDFSSDEITSIITPDFLRWVGFNGVDFATNNSFDELNSFTFNHTGSIDTIAKRPLKGHWRGVYKYFYDTDRPHTHPWEMLGFREQPEWWETVYGPAPYTSGNLVMWGDLEAGRIADPKYTRIDSLYARPGLSKIIPVDESGELLSPTDSGLASTPIVNVNDPKRVIMLRSEQIAAKWAIGDHSPAETAWRRSSWFPFAIQVALALTKPADYAALMFDTSRMKYNLAGEWRYGEQEEFLSPAVVSLFNEVIDDVRTLASGYSVFVIEAGQQRNENYLAELKDIMSSVEYRLMVKLGGFASKEKLQVSIDSTDLSSPYPGALLPVEDYQIFFNKSNPIESVGISGMIIQKTATGWSIRGYDRYKPYFTVFKPFVSNLDQVERVGGVSEKFFTWTQNTTYSTGQVVFYQERYYRVVSRHNSGSVFNSTYYQSLPYLPVVGGVGVLRRTRFDKTEVTVPYGVEYNTLQEVYDLIVGYGKWLESKGFIFDEFNQDLEQILDWSFTAKEFLFWTTQNWAINSVITLSPFANKIVYRSNSGIVDSVVNVFQEYSLLKADGAMFPKTNFTIVRLDGEFVISTVKTQEGLFFARINVTQKEHALVMDNFTIFNDVVYAVETGYRQRRLRIKGFITDNWNGDFFSPGFVFDQANISDWQKFSDYRIGDVVRFSGNYYSAVKSIPGSATFDITQWALLNSKPSAQLIPNFDYKINQFEDFYSLDIDNFDAAQQLMAQHLIGYTPRPYLNYIIGDPIAQYKFYQGYIREKGTRNPLDKLSKASLANFRTSVDFNEEWAFRIGHYGGYNTFQELEFNLDTTKFLENPQILEFVDNEPSVNAGAIYYKDFNSLIVKPDSFNITSVFDTTTSTESVIQMPYAGYVRLNDVTATAYNKNSVLDIANNRALVAGNTIWLGFREDGEWDVLRVTDVPTFISNVEISVPGQSLIISTYYAHQLAVGDLISVVNVASGVDQCYIVQEILNNNQFLVLTTIAALPVLSDPVRGLIFAFKSSRLETFDNLAEIPFLDRWNVDEKIWIDSDNSGNWAVYKKTHNYTATTYIAESSTVKGKHYGSSIAASDNSDIVLISAPDYISSSSQYSGRVFVLYRNTYNELQVIDEFSLIDEGNQFYYSASSSTTATSYGYAIALDTSKVYGDTPQNFIVASAPYTSRVKAVSTGANSHIIDVSAVAFTTATNQGLVKLSLLSTTTNQLISSKSIALTTPISQNSSTYGYSIALSTPYASTTTLRVLDSVIEWIDNGFEYAVTGTNIVGTPLVVRTETNHLILDVPQHINTASTVHFSTTVKGYTAIEETSSTTISVANTSGIVVNCSLSGEFIVGNPTVTEVGNGSVTVSAAQTIYTATLINFVVTSTNLAYTPGTTQMLMVGAPAIDSTITGQVYVYSLDVHPGTTGSISVSTGSIAVATNSFSRLPYTSNTTTNTLFGFDIAKNRAMTRIAVAAPRYQHSVDSAVGAVYVYDFTLNTTTHIAIITGTDVTPTLSSYDLFASNVEMSEDGEYLIIGSPYAFDTSYSLRSGVVDIFRWHSTSSSFQWNQRISAPISVITTVTSFGYDISLNSTNETLVISSLGEVKTVKPTFDKFTRRYSATDISSFGFESVFVNDPDSTPRTFVTRFDGGATLFSDKIKDAGTAHVFNKLGSGSTKWSYAEQLIDNDIATSSTYGWSVVSLNDCVFVGAPAKVTNGNNDGIGQFFVYDKIDTDINSWQLYRNQEPLVNPSSLERVISINTDEEQIDDYFDVVDPIKGKILGSAQEELRFVSGYDPAIYSLGISGVNVDSNSNWLDEHVGDLWWDLSTVKYVWYEQGELEYRKNNWNGVFPGSSIDVYEWVRSEYLPADWAQIADTAEGLTKGISGQPKFNDNSVISVKQVYNSVSNSFVNVYYYWVKNKVVAPSNVKNRSQSAFDIAQQIADPIRTGARFVSLISPTAMMMANTKPGVTTEHINLNIAFDSNKDSANRHTEWLLLQENDPDSKPNWLLEKKLIDSLLGHDSLGNPVPDPLLPSKIRYGVGIRPRQSLFVNRREALRNVVEFANSVFINKRLTGQVSFSNLNAIEELPNESLYDSIIEDIYLIDLIPTRALTRAQLTAEVDSNGSIYNVVINNPGFGYQTPPTISVIDNGTGAELVANINEFGQVSSVDIINGGKNYTTDVELVVRPFTVVVQADIESAGRWAIYEWSGSKWIKTRTQDYNTPLYWKYVDWKSVNYDPRKIIISTVAEPYALEVLERIATGSYVKVQNGGDGRYLILEKTDGTAGSFEPNWDIVYSEKGTIQLLESLWNPAAGLYSWDQIIGFDQTQYDQSPDSEIAFILAAIRDDIFVGDLKGYWNQLFFKTVRYAMSEQKFLDWAFKTTFISVINNAGPLDQPSSYKLQSAEYYESFLKEIKPYHTKIRKYTELYTSTEWTNTFNTDFDMPVYYNTSTLNFNKVEFGNDMMLTYPWKAWYDNYTYSVETVDLYDGGEGYTQVPKVTIVTAPGDSGFGAEAVAYVSLGKVVSIVVTNPGRGYTATPSVIISGGGSTTLTAARAYAQLGMSPVRFNKVHLKFDRTSVNREVGSQYTSETFISDGYDVEFPLTWAPLADKEKITLTRNGILQLLDTFTVIYNTQEHITQLNNLGSVISSYSKLFATLKLNFIPDSGDVLEITYPKSLDLYNAAGRIQDYYQPSVGMPGAGKEIAIAVVSSEVINNNIIPVDSVSSIKVGSVMTFSNQGEFEYYEVVDIVSTTEIKISEPVTLPSGTSLTFTYFDLSQLITGAEYSGLQVIGLPFNAAGGWEAPGIPWASTSWDNLGVEEGYTVYSTSSVSTATFTIPTLIATGTEVNIYMRSASDATVAGIRIDDANFKLYQGTWSDAVSYSTSSIVLYDGNFYQTIKAVSTGSFAPTSTASWVSVSYNTQAVATTLVGLGTGAVDKIEVVVSGTGYVSAYTTCTISAPTSLTGRTAKATIAANTAGNISITLIDAGSGYSEPPIITIIESISTSHQTSSVTIPAYARATLKAEFREIDSSNTLTVATIPSIAFTTTSTLVMFRYSTSDGTVTPTDNDSLDALISGGDLSMTTALGLSPSEIILDGGSTSTRHITGMNDDGFLNPINSYAPEECVPGQVQEAIGISVFTQPASSSPLITNKRYWVNGVQRTYGLGVRPATAESIIVLFNDETLSSDNYVVNYDANTITLTSTYISTGWLSITTMQLGAIKLVDSFTITTSSSRTVWTSSISQSDVGSSFVTVNGQKVTQSASTTTAGTYASTSEWSKGAAQVIVNSSGTIQIYLFNGAEKSFSEINDENVMVDITYLERFETTSTSTLSLSVAPGIAEPFHSQVIVTKNGRRLSPPVTTYYQVEGTQRIFDISKSINYPPNIVDLVHLEVYVNGVISPSTSKKWTLDQTTGQVKFKKTALSSGDLVAFVVKFGHDYLIYGNQVLLVTPAVRDDNFVITTFTNHDPDFIRSERFDGNPANQYTMQRTVVNSAYVWVTYNGRPLSVNLDYTVGLDNRTVTIRDGFYNGLNDSVVITSFADREPMIAYRIFRDMIGRTHYKRLSAINTTILSQNLYIDDDMIVVEDASVLTLPDPRFNKPGVVLVDGERIEFFVIQNNNTLRQLRRGTLGTTPKDVVYAGTQVVDQGSGQTVPFQEDLMIHSYVTATNTTTNEYIIPVENITFDTEDDVFGRPAEPAVNQVEIRYQGRMLLKPGTTGSNYSSNVRLAVHHINENFDSTSTISTIGTADTFVQPDFEIITATNTIVLNTNTITLVEGARLEIIKRRSQIWYNAETTLSKNTTPQAKFLSSTPAVMPRFLSSATYIVTDLTWYTESGVAITDEKDRPLEGI